MAGNTGPNIVNNGLVLHLDASNTKSFRGEPTTNEIAQVSWGGDGVNQSGLTKGSISITDENLKYNGYPTHLWTPGGSYNVYMGGDSNKLSTVWTFSCYIKREDGVAITSLNVYMYYPTGDGSAAGTIEDAGNGWYRVSRTRTGTNNYLSLIGFTGFVAGKKYYLSGAQLEKKAYPTAYVATNTTRGTTVATGGGWADLTRNSNHSELVNGPTYNASNGGSIVFDGTNDYINSTNISNQFTGDVTAEAWMKVTSSPTDWVRIVGTGGNGGNNRTFGLWYAIDRRILWQRNGGQDPGIFPTTPLIPLNSWCHVVATTSGSSHVIYFNGTSIGTQTATGPWASSNEAITIGFAGFHTYTTSNISQIKLYNRGLSASEVLQNYNSQKSRFGLP